MENLRIRTTPLTDDYVTININQKFKHLEILSLKISQEDLYYSPFSNYGVIVGRVVANGGFGVPNAKISVFIPLDEEDAQNNLISTIYPFQTVNSVNSDGVRYNLLPNTKNNECLTAVGTFSNKREILDDNNKIKVYEKYYQFTTTTNESGDYMIFGVPLGLQPVHFDVDISDIGFISQKPYDLQLQGYSPSLFESNTTFKSSTNLNELPQIVTFNSSKQIFPLWGDSSNTTIGINRLDFEIPLSIKANALFFGANFTDSKKHQVNKHCRPRRNVGKNCDLTSGLGKVEMIRRISEDSNEVEYLQPTISKIDDDGNWSFPIEMNMKPKVTDEFGNLIDSEDPQIGIFTKALYRFRISNDNLLNNLRRRTAHTLVPNMFNRFQFDETTEDEDFFEVTWKKLYSVTQYIPRFQKNKNENNKNFIGIKKIGECEKNNPFPYNRVDYDFNPLYTVICIILEIVAKIINFVNRLITVIIFGILVKMICFVKHLFKPSKRAGCRCSGCLKLIYNSMIGDSSANDFEDQIVISDDERDDIVDAGLMTLGEIACAVSYDDEILLDVEETGSTITGCDSSQCKTCKVTIIELSCDDKTFTDAENWADCVKESIAQRLGVISFEFYNDWVIGSLYQPLFKYKIKYKRKGKVFEKFCDLDCHDAIDNPIDSSDEHYKNKCRDTHIVDSKIMNDYAGATYFESSDSTYDNVDKGIVVEYEDFLYYAARHDVLSNSLNPPSLTVAEKNKLLFATNLIELGSIVKCDIDNQPFIVDNLESTSYQNEEGTNTIFSVSNCFRFDDDDLNSLGLLLISQSGVDIVVAGHETNNNDPSPATIESEGGEIFTFNSTTNNLSQLPDYDNNINTILFDREDTQLRELLCENFKYYNVQGNYVLTDTSTDTYFLVDEDGDRLIQNLDVCENFDDIENLITRIHPYYTYFGVSQSNSSLDKLKNQYFDKCI